MPHLNKKYISLFAFIAIIICSLFFSASDSYAEIGKDSIAFNWGSSFKSSLDEDTLNIFGRNNILFYNPNACLGGGGAGLLAGNTIEEKVWNYFVNANIPGVSDNAAVIAGIMGNLYAESNYDPFVYNNGTWGIYQTEPSNIKSLVEAEIPSPPWRKSSNGDPSKYPEDITVRAINIELNQLTQKNQRFQQFLNDFSKVSVSTGEAGAASFAELFLVHLERAVFSEACIRGSTVNNNGYPLSDPGVQRAANDLYKGIPKCQGVPYQDADKRTKYAKEIYDKYSSSTSTSSSSSLSSKAVSPSFSTLHAPSGDGWLSNLEGWEKSELSSSAGNCTKYDSSIGSGYIPEAGGGTRLPQFVILHYTRGWTLSDYCDTESGVVAPPHFTIDLVNKKIYQHFSIKDNSAAVVGGEGEWDRWGIQIEIMGCGNTDPKGEECTTYNKPEYDFKNFGNEHWDYLATLLVEIAKQTGIPLESSLDWSKENRLSTSAMKSYVGVIGHQHIQGNTNTDPGPIWDKVKAAIDRNPNYSVGCGGGGSSSGNKYCAEGETCTSDGFTAYSQGDTRWGGRSFGSTDMRNAGCGPSAFATAATNLLHRKITPLEVWEYSTSQGITKPPEPQEVQKYAEKYSLEFKDLKPEFSSRAGMEQTINNYLNNGWLLEVVLSAKNDNCFTGGAHFVVIREVTANGKWKIATNPGKTTANCSSFTGSSNLQNEVEWDPAYIVSHIDVGNTNVALRSSNSGACLDTCSEQLSGALKSGGMTLEEANKFMETYYKEASKRARGDQRLEGALIRDGGCIAGGTLNNCSAFSEWFVNRYTTAGPDIGGFQGSQAVQVLLGLNKGFVDGGHTPRVYAVMSMGPYTGSTASGKYYNHTGIVLGIDEANDKIIIGEATCHGGFIEGSWPGAHEYSLEKYTSTEEYAPTYAYTDNILKDIK